MHADASEETALEVGDEAGTAQPQEDETGKWWTKCFSRAGKMGSRPAETKIPTKPKVNFVYPAVAQVSSNMSAMQCASLGLAIAAGDGIAESLI